MRNKLVFPSGGTETKYVWNKSTINDKGVFVWDKNDIITIDTYYWNKHKVNFDENILIYNWEKYYPSKSYAWNKYSYIGTYYWDKYNTEIIENERCVAKKHTAASKLQFFSSLPFGATTITTSSSKINIQFKTTDADRIFTFYYIEPANETSLNKIKTISYTAAELGVILRDLYDYNTSLALRINNSTIIGFNDSGFNNDKVVIFDNSSSAQRYNAKFQLENIEEMTVYYSNSKLTCVNKDAFDKAYWQYYDFMKNTTPPEDLLPYKFTNPNISSSGQRNDYFNAYFPVLTSSSESIALPSEYVSYLYSNPTGIFNCLMTGNGSTQVSYSNIVYYKAVKQKTDKVGQVSSNFETEYPKNDYINDYWYEFVNTEYEKIKLIEVVEADEIDAYPEDGIQDGFWYVSKPVYNYYDWNKYAAIENGIQQTKFRANKYTTSSSDLYIFPSVLDSNSGRTYEYIYDSLVDYSLASFTYGEFSYYIAATDSNGEIDTVIQGGTPKDFTTYIHNLNIDKSITQFKLSDYTDVLAIGRESTNEFFVVKDSTLVYIQQRDSNNKITKFALDNVYEFVNPRAKVYVNGVYANTTVPISFRGSALFIDSTYEELDVMLSTRSYYYIANPRTILNSFAIGEVDVLKGTAEFDSILAKYNVIPNSGIIVDNGNIYTNLTAIEEMTYLKGDFIEVVSSTNTTSYPADGVYNGYWYESTGVNTDEYKFIEDLSSQNENQYPKNDYLDGFYYKYVGTTRGANALGDLIEEVSSLNRAEYPDDDILGEYWYIYTKEIRTFEMGEYLERVEATDEEAYPKYGVQGLYWYNYKGWEDTDRYEGRFIQQIETNDEMAYPVNGIYMNYWYKYIGSYEGYKLVIDDSNIKGGIDYNIDINPEEDYMVGSVAAGEVAFKYNNKDNDIQKYIDANECIYYTWQADDKDWRKVGKFYLEDMTEIRTEVNLKAYDATIKSEKYVDDFINQTSFPISLNNFFINLCEFLGVVGVVKDNIANKTTMIKDNFEAVNITGRQVLQYIAEMAGGFVKTDKDGKLVLQGYSAKNINLDKSKYKKHMKHNYTVAGIEGLNVRVTQDDMGVSAGAESGNIYIIENNPLFYTESTGEIQGAVNNLYAALQNKRYVPAEVEMYQDFGIEAGDIIKVEGDTFYVMSKKLSSSGCVLKCVGNKTRQLVESGLNGEIIALRGKTNELYRDLEQTKSTLTDISADLRTEISQTAEQVKLYASNLNQTLNSSITVKLNNITSEVNNLESELSSRIEQTESSITSQITEQNKIVTEIRQDLDGISLTYDGDNGTASITIGDITVTDLVNGEYVSKTVAGINLDGYVTFTSLAASGQTTINGDNITTGTISADRINMKGAITWSDLDGEVQDYIDAGVSGDVDIPDYIQSSHIDGARIESPTINGGTLNSVAAYGDATHTTTIADSQISFNIREYSGTGGSFGYTAGVIDAYVNDTGMPSSARTGLKIESYSDGSSYSGGLSLVANRGLVLQSKNQDIFFYLPGRNPVALSTILDKLGL